MKRTFDKVRAFLSSMKLAGLHKAAMLVIAVVSVSIAISKHAITKSENIPALKTVAVMDSEQESSGVFVENMGLAPLRIKSVHIYDKAGNAVKNNSADWNKQFNSALDHRFRISPLYPKSALEKNDRHWLIKSHTNSSIEAVSVKNFLESVSIEVCYCSLTNQCESKTIGLKGHPHQQCHA